MKVTRKQGFTLIELLVVIVIIGILAGALFGPITNALASARRSGMARTGQHIVQQMIAAESSKRYGTKVWPSTKQASSTSTNTTGPNMNRTFSDTADYFTEALYMKESNADNRNRLKVLQGIEPNDLVAEGYTAASGTTIEDENCAWVIAANARSASGKVPVLISRNFNCSTFIGASYDDAGQDYTTLLTESEPFGQDGCVIIYRDGSAADFAAADVVMSALVPLGGNGKLSDIEQDGEAFKFLEFGN